MKKTIWSILSTSAVTLAAIPLMSSTAFAATDNFSSEYQAKAQQEQSLWAQVQASNVTSSSIQALEQTVTNIETQTTALYNALQALNDGVSSIPQIDEKQIGDIKVLEGRRQEIINANKKSLNDIQLDIKHHQKAALKHDTQQHKYWSYQLSHVNAEIKALEKKYGIGSAPYLGARPSLETSILHLEDSAICYTNEIIQLQSQGASAASTPVPSTSDSSTSSTN
jgi:exonuclease VII small subunit